MKVFFSWQRSNSIERQPLEKLKADYKPLNHQAKIQTHVRAHMHIKENKKIHIVKQRTEEALK